jgi:hypothetical protein
MLKRQAVLRIMLGIGLLFGSLAYAQMPMTQKSGQVKPPVENINAKKHPNLAAAQRLCDQAFEKIQAAQQANEFDLEGHAAKAKELLDQASKDLKQAAMASTKEHQ